MHGLASYEQRCSLYSRSATLDRKLDLERMVHLPLAKHTPDLVLDLPEPALLTTSSAGLENSISSPPLNSSCSITNVTPIVTATGEGSEKQDEIDSTTATAKTSEVAPAPVSSATTADTFAEESHETMRKRPTPAVTRPQVSILCVSSKI